MESLRMSGISVWHRVKVGLENTHGRGVKKMLD